MEEVDAVAAVDVVAADVVEEEITSIVFAFTTILSL